ncbi:MAG: hypothetical protein V4659_11450 [Pseudomonadota bacterium]
MKYALPLLALALAACNQNAGPEVVDTTAPDPNAAELANRPMAELPPAMRAQAVFRCGDGSVAFIDWYAGDKQADFRHVRTDDAKRLTSSAGGSPWTSADGWKLTGNDKNIVLVEPGKPTLTCHT